MASEEESKRFSGIVYVEDWNGKLLKSIYHKDGQMFLYEPEKDDNSGGRVATVAYAKRSQTGTPVPPVTAEPHGLVIIHTPR